MPELGAPPPPDESELYDGPTKEQVENVIRPPLFSGRPPIEEEPPIASYFPPPRQPDDPGVQTSDDSQARYVKTMSLALDVLSARLMVLIAMLGGLAVWGVTIWAPDPFRLIGAAGYSVLVILPAIYLSLRK